MLNKTQAGAWAYFCVLLMLRNAGIWCSQGVSHQRGGGAGTFL